MVSPDVLNKTYFELYKSVTPQNLVKLVLRASQLYDARVEASKIFKLITEIEQYLKPRSLAWRIMQDDDSLVKISESHKTILKNIV